MEEFDYFEDFRQGYLFEDLLDCFVGASFSMEFPAAQIVFFYGDGSLVFQLDYSLLILQAFSHPYQSLIHLLFL